MKNLQRLTTQYNETEDRLSVIGAISPDETVTLWLNHRLLVRLLPHLFTWLERQSDDSIPVEIAQSFAQGAAKAQLVEETPVSVAPASQEWLVEAVDLTPNVGNLTLTFRTDKQAPVTLQLPTQHLRQWLEIVHSLWRVAEWPMQVWPAWVENKPNDSLISNPKHLH